MINADFARAMKRLVPDRLRRRWTDRRIAGKQFSCSTFMLYLGLEGRCDNLEHHTIYLPRDYEANLADIEDRHVLSADPAFYVQNACVTDPGLAPPGMSTLYVLVPVTHAHPNVDWRVEKDRFRAVVLRSSPRWGSRISTRRIRFERVTTPDDWDRGLEIHLARHSTWPTASDSYCICVREIGLKTWNRCIWWGAALTRGADCPSFSSRRGSARGWCWKTWACLRTGRSRDRQAGLVWEWSPPSPSAARSIDVMNSNTRPWACVGATLMKTAQAARVGVIGGGIGGLAAACTLAARGHDVVVLERNSEIGGKAALLEERGFRFDMGPTILILPSVLARIFAEAGQRLEDELELVALDPQWRAFFDDGSTLDLVADIDKMSERLQAFSGHPAAAQGYRRFMADCQNLHALSDRFFFWRSVGSLLDIFDGRAFLQPSVLRDVIRMCREERSPGRYGRTSPTRAWRRCSTTSRSTSARRLMRRRGCCAESPTCRRRKACGIRREERGPCRGHSPDWPASWASNFVPIRPCGAS